MDFRKIKASNLSVLLGILVLVFSYQNCGNVNVAPIAQYEKLSCDTSIYNIAYESQVYEGSTVYFVQQNNHILTREYADAITWFVDGVEQDGNIVHENRLFLDCSVHPEEVVTITAKFVTDCGIEIEIEAPSAPHVCEEIEDIIEDPPPTPPTEYTGNSCEDYKTWLESRGELDHFNEYQAENRGFTKVARDFEQFTDRILGGARTGPIERSPPVLPGYLEDNQYLALSFSLKPQSETNTGKFALSFQPPVGLGKEHNIVATISPCPGDFRPQNVESTDPFLIPIAFRKQYSMVNVIRGSTLDGTPSVLYKLPANKVFYMNFSLRNLYLPGTVETLPSDTCEWNEGCGSGPSLSK